MCSRTLRIRRLSEVAVLSVVIGSAFYITLFLYAYRGSLENFILSFKGGNAIYILAVFALRFLSLTIHGIAWWVLIRALRPISKVKTLKVTYSSVFTEFIIPIGGITEIVKVALLTKLKLLRSDEAIASLFAHRIVLSFSIFLITFIALMILDAPLILYIALIIPSLILVIVNIAGFIIPSFYRIESILDKVLSRFGLNIKGFSFRYSSSMKGVVGNLLFMTSSLILSICERFLNALYGVSIAMLIGIKLDIIRAILAFDSLYAILWLFPLITPGGLGIYETIQTSLLNFLGIELSQAATASIISRIAYLVVGYGLFTYSTLTLGLSLRGIIKSISTRS